MAPPEVELPFITAEIHVWWPMLPSPLNVADWVTPAPPAPLSSFEFKAAALRCCWLVEVPPEAEAMLPPPSIKLFLLMYDVVAGCLRVEEDPPPVLFFLMT